MRHEESIIQQTCVLWFRNTFPNLWRLLFSIPNGGYRRPREGQILKAEGIVPGASDLLFLCPNKEYHGLCIEMKTPIGKLSKYQQEWRYAVEAAGYKYMVCRSVDAFQVAIYEYLSNK